MDNFWLTITVVMSLGCGGLYYLVAVRTVATERDIAESIVGILLLVVLLVSLGIVAIQTLVGGLHEC